MFALDSPCRGAKGVPADALVMVVISL